MSLIILLLFSLSSPCLVGAEPDASPAPASAAQRIHKDIAMLSADDMEGRAVGTAGEEKAARYLAGRFEALGLQPVKGSYFQSVSLVGVAKQAATMSFARGGQPFPVELAEHVSFWSTTLEPSVELSDRPLVFVGYGVEAPEHTWDDFKGQDLKGKVLLFLNDDPQVTENGQELFKGEARTYYGRYTYKFEEAFRRGAAGAFVIHTEPTASYPFSVVQQMGKSEAFALDRPGSGYQLGLVGWIDEATSTRIAKELGFSLNELVAKAQKRDFRPMDTGLTISAKLTKTIRKIKATNVWGVLPGKDPAKKDEVLVVTAHFDHLGVDPEVKEGDRVYNGAWDNAAGTSCLMELASMLSRGKPLERSVLFLATTGEEKGTLGSRWFVENSPFPMRDLIANFNIDMPQIFGPTADIAAIGVEMSTLGTTLREVAAARKVVMSGKEEPLVITGDAQPRQGSFYRSDQVHFAKAGVPALFLNPGKRYVKAPPVDVDQYETDHYHQKSDQIEASWNLEGAVRDLEVLEETMRRVAAAEAVPTWVPGNEFEDAFKKRRAAK